MEREAPVRAGKSWSPTWLSYRSAHGLRAFIARITSTRSFCSLPLFPFGAFAIDALCHRLDRLHDLFEYRLVLEKDHLAGRVLERLFCDLQAFVDKKEKVLAMRGAHLFHLALDRKSVV